MAGFETRAIWGSDPGLVSDRFRYTGVSVPPLDEEAIKRIQESTKQVVQVPLPSPSEVLALQDIERLKAFEDQIKQKFKGDAFADLRRVAGIQLQPAAGIQPAGDIKLQPGDVFSDPRISDLLDADLKAGLVQVSAVKNRPNVFQQLVNKFGQELKGTGAGIKELGRIAADAVIPNRNKVPGYMLDFIETPEFIEAKKQQQLLGSAPNVSIAPGQLSEKQSRWLLDPRRTPVVGEGAFGSVTVPERSGKAFKVQEGQSKKFLENEIEMALRTAELGIGPQVYSATLQPLGKPLSYGPKEEAYRAIVRTEAVPHRQFQNLSPEEQKFLDLERYKVTEGLYRGGIENLDAHFGNILLNDATKKAVQVDSGLAREYDAFNEGQLQSRLRNIVAGLSNAGMRDIAKDTSEIGNALLNEAWKANTPEMYAEVENFFNRSGNILMRQSRPLIKPTPPSVKNNKIPLVKTGLASIGIDALAGYALGQPADQALVDAVTAPISSDALGGRPLAAIERLGPRGEFVDTKTNTVLNPQGRYTNTGIAYKGGKPVIVPRGSVAGEGNFGTQAKAVLGNALNAWKQRLGALGIFGR